MAERLDMILLDGLDRAGDAAFESWLAAEREDAEAARVAVLRQLATHPEIQAVAARKWLRLWHDADPSSAEAHERVTSPAPAPLAAAVGACSQRRCLSRATMPHR
jgi:hypothetical protein